MGNNNSNILTSKQANLVIKSINDINPIEFDFDPDCQEALLLDKKNELKIETFVEIYDQLVDEFLPQIKAYFTAIKNFTYCSTDLEVYTCPKNKYFKIYKVPTLSVTTSALSDNYNISMIELGQSSGSLVGLDGCVVDLKIYDGNLMYLFEEVKIGSLNEQNQLQLVNLNKNKSK
jgi:hypothetical protein